MFSHIACMLGALALLGGCKSTPLDVVYAADVAGAGSGVDAAGAAGGVGAGGAGGGGAGSGGAANGGAGSGAAGSGGAPVDVGPCSMVGPGRYVLRSQANGLCLGQGAPTTVFGSPGFLLDFAADCRLPARSWQLSASAAASVFTLQNLSSGFVLDVQMAAIRDGTPVITFGETGFDNQRFEVRARDTFASELRPQHHPQSCVSASPTGAEITACEPTNSTQAWLLQRSDCL
jgi:hypothetical protein